MSDEDAKAVQAASKAWEETLKALEGLGILSSRFLGPTPEFLAIGMGARAQLWAYKQILTVADMVHQIRNERQLAGKTVPLAARVSLPLIEAISSEDDPTLQGMWANLIANGTDPAKRLGVERVYISILRDMSGPDALIFQHLGKQGWKVVPDSPVAGVTISSIAEQTGLDKADVRVSIANLSRLGVTADGGPYFIRDTDRRHSRAPSLPDTAEIRITPLGSRLIALCGVVSDADG
jgi:hypothetical protein